MPFRLRAGQKLLDEGLNPPRIGLFYDTSTLQYNAWHYHADLTTDYGRDWFYADLNGPFTGTPPDPGDLTVSASSDATPPATPSRKR